MEPTELNQEASEGEDEEETDTVHRNAGRQAKDCLRKALGLVKDIFRKFSYDKEFIAGFSEVVFREIIRDQLPLLKQRYVCDKSQLLEMVCIAWPEHQHTLENFLRYEGVMPAAMDMLTHGSVSADVASLLVGLLKSLILGTVEQQEKGKGSQANSERRRAFRQEMEEERAQELGGDDEASAGEQDEAMLDE